MPSSSSSYPKKAGPFAPHSAPATHERERERKTHTHTHCCFNRGGGGGGGGGGVLDAMVRCPLSFVVEEDSGNQREREKKKKKRRERLFTGSVAAWRQAKRVAAGLLVGHVFCTCFALPFLVTQERERERETIVIKILPPHLKKKCHPRVGQIMTVRCLRC